jgi:hypothetical protein
MRIIPPSPPKFIGSAKPDSEADWVSLSKYFQAVTAYLVAQSGQYTVATLPNPPSQYQMAWVTDASSPTFLGIITGGGSTVCPVFYNGSHWVAF